MKIDIDNTIPNTLTQANIWEGLIVNNKDDNKKVTKEIVFIRYIVLNLTLQKYWIVLIYASD